jgi:hypothetical protein
MCRRDTRRALACERSFEFPQFPLCPLSGRHSFARAKTPTLPALAILAGEAAQRADGINPDDLGELHEFLEIDAPVAFSHLTQRGFDAVGGESLDERNEDDGLAAVFFVQPIVLINAHALDQRRPSAGISGRYHMVRPFGARWRARSFQRRPRSRPHCPNTLPSRIEQVTDPIRIENISALPMPPV